MLLALPSHSCDNALMLSDVVVADWIGDFGCDGNKVWVCGTFQYQWQATFFRQRLEAAYSSKYDIAFVGVPDNYFCKYNPGAVVTVKTYDFTAKYDRTWTHSSGWKPNRCSTCVVDVTYRCHKAPSPSRSPVRGPTPSQYPARGPTPSHGPCPSRGATPSQYPARGPSLPAALLPPTTLSAAPRRPTTLTTVPPPPARLPADPRPPRPLPAAQAQARPRPGAPAPARDPASRRATRCTSVVVKNVWQ